MKPYSRAALLRSVSIFAGLLAPVAANAQDASDTPGLAEIIVTAQKRAQSIQDVPIAVTAIGEDVLQANRITSIGDLSGLAPGLTIMPSAGSSKLPSITMRGVVALGVVPGSDREVSMYIDGVYVAAARGGIFDLPDVSRIEVLRGPQGTLFGRNATAGAISISTREPTGEFGVRATGSVGNYDLRRIYASVELPRIGPFSGYVSFTHNQRNGDVRNTAAGQVWDLRASQLPSLARVVRSPKYLGSKDSDSWFAALKFESGDFTTTYKFDRLDANDTPDATGFVGYNADAPLVGALLTSLIETQSHPVPITPSGKRPDAVANGFAMPSPQTAEGHNLTSTYQLSDEVSVKNVFAYRTAFIFGAGALDGVSTLTITPQAIGPFATLAAFSTVPGLAQASPAVQAATIGQFATNLAPLVGSPFAGVVNNVDSRDKQFSDELQINYNSSFLTATVGALWYNAKNWTQRSLFPTTITFSPIPGGVISNANFGSTFNEITSLAAYAQLEFHVSSQLDLIAGGRLTRDKKTGRFTYGPNLANISETNFEYKKTKPSFLVGVNYKPSQNTLIYGKFSTAFVSGGSVAGISFPPETVASWEFGVKSELFDRKLRANLALFHAKYNNIQQANSTATPGYAEYIAQATGNPDLASFIGTFVTPIGDIRAQGFEFDFDAAPVSGVNLGGSLSYTDSKHSNAPAIFLAAQYNGEYKLNFRPDWTARLWAQYETPPLGTSNARLSFRVDGQWQSRMLLAPSPSDPAYQTFAVGIRDVPAYWVFNGRVALKDLEIGGVSTEIAAWAKNFGNNRSANYAINLGVMAAANYIPARTYGMDLSVAF